VRQTHKYLVWAGIGVLAVATVVTFSRAQAPPPASLPDMEVHSITAPSSGTHGMPISVVDVTTNIGTANGAQSITAYYLCQSLTGVSSSCWITNHTTSGVAKGKSWPWGGNVTVPASQPLGTNYLVVVCNYNKLLAESNYFNNTNHVMIIIN
jgi:hypothetical protein